MCATDPAVYTSTGTGIGTVIVMGTGAGTGVGTLHVATIRPCLHINLWVVRDRL